MGKRTITGIGNTETASDLIEQLIEHDLITRDEDRRFSDTPLVSGDPTKDIGTALRLADYYNIELHGGMTRWSVRAIYRYPGRDILWFDRPTVQEAVCTCIVACAEKGIVCRNLDYKLKPHRPCSGE